MSTAGPHGDVLIGSSDPHVAEVVRDALNRVHDVVVLHRLNRSAGRRDWYVMRQASDLPVILGRGQSGDAFTLFLEPHLQVRGIINEGFEREVSKLLASVNEYRSEVILGEELPSQVQLQGVEGFGKDEVDQAMTWLRERRGHRAVAGLHPPGGSNDATKQMIAYVPDESGRVVLGVY